MAFFKIGDLAKFKQHAYSSGEFNGNIPFSYGITGSSNDDTFVPTALVNGALVEICAVEGAIMVHHYRIHLVAHGLFRSVICDRLEPL